MKNPLKDPALAYALQDARERLMPADPRITSVGIGFGLKGGQETGEICLQIGVEEKLPPEKIASERLLPASLQTRTPGTEPIRLDVVSTGILSAGRLDLRSEQRPAVPGCSIGHFRSTAGTLGAVLSDRRRRRYILSNNHVLANENEAHQGDPILQPGPADGGTEQGSIIARLHSFVPLDIDMDGINRVDCALAAAERDGDLQPQIAGLGTIVGVSTPELGTAVRKCGRTTELTAGRIRRVAITARVHYRCGELLFTDLAETGGMSAPGDSGSILLDSGNRALGLLFAGSTFSTLMCPVPAVIESLELTDLDWF